MDGTHLIKKYANRKLYDTVTRRYVTLDVLASLVAEGIGVRVVDQTSGDDITQATMSQLPGSGGGSRRSSVRRTATARSGKTAGSRTRSTVKGRVAPLSGVLRGSLGLPASIGQRAVEEIGRRASFDAVFGKRGGEPAAATAAEVAELRSQLRALTREVERLHGELAELRPVGHPVAR